MRYQFLVYTLLLLVFLVPLTAGHAGEEHASDEDAAEHRSQTGSTINPFAYYEDGAWTAGTIALALWILSLFALLMLSLPIVGRLFEF